MLNMPAKLRALKNKKLNIFYFMHKKSPISGDFFISQAEMHIYKANNSFPYSI